MTLVLDRERTVEKTKALQDQARAELINSASAPNPAEVNIPEYKVDINGVLYRILPDGKISHPVEEFPEGFLARFTTEELVAERLRRQKDPYWYEKQKGLPEPVALPKPLAIHNDRPAHIKTNTRRRLSYT